MKRSTLIILAAVLVALIAVAAILYNKLSEGFTLDRLSQLSPTAEPGADIPAEPEETPAALEETPIAEPGNSPLPTAEPTPKPTPMIAPDFTVYDGDGNAVSLHEMFGKPIVLNFWASWCGPCKNEMPDFEELYKELGEDVVFMMVNMTDNYMETLDDAKAFIADSGYTFPVYYDTDLLAAMTYGVSSIPQTYFINGKGQLMGHGPGMLDRDTILRGISYIQ